MLKNRIATHSLIQNLSRLWRHMTTMPTEVKRCFSDAAMQRITQAIRDNEAQHSGEICFAVEANLRMRELLGKKTAVARSIEVFSNLRVWDTEQNNGILIYLLMADHDFEILADRGIYARVEDTVWDQISLEMEGLFKRGEFEAGVLYGVEKVGALLAQHYPPDQKKRNELPDGPVVL